MLLFDFSTIQTKFFINNTQTTPKTKITLKTKTRKPLILKDLRVVFIGAANGT